MNTFKFVGHIKKIESKNDKKVFIETKTLPSGWVIKKVKFLVTCGDSTQFVEISGGKHSDDSKNTVYTLKYKNPGDVKQGVEKAQFDWDERFEQSVIDQVPNYKRYTVDLASDKLRDKLSSDGKEEEAKALANKKYTYLTAYDFAERVEKLLNAGAFGDKTYVVTGTLDWSYSIGKDGLGRYYRNFTPTSIYLASEEESVGCTGKVDFYYAQQDYIGEPLENGDIPLVGYMQFYDSAAKDRYYAPVALYLKEGYDKNAALRSILDLEKPENEDAEILVLGLTVEYFNAAPQRPVELSDLGEDDLRLINCGLKTLEEIQAENSYGIVEEKVERIYVNNIARGYRAPQNPEVTFEKVQETPSNIKETTKKATVSQKDIDLFDEDYDNI